MPSFTLNTLEALNPVVKASFALGIISIRKRIQAMQTNLAEKLPTSSTSTCPQGSETNMICLLEQATKRV